MKDIINKIVLHICYRCGEDEDVRGIKHDCDDCILSDVIEEIKSIKGRPHGEWVEPQLIYADAHKVTCTNCGGRVVIVGETNFCPNCGADMRSEKEYLDKTFPEHECGEWFDITDMMTRENKE